MLKNDNQLAMLFTLANLFRVDQMIRQWERSPVKTGNNARNGGKNSLNRLIRCVCGKKIGPDPRNFNQRVSLGRNDLLIRTFLNCEVDMTKKKHCVWTLSLLFISLIKKTLPDGSVSQ
ncbi:hypothetical protein LNP20_00675 [Klebsiella pneumoniae subsp. pneumoniae]|nr:hypothetical protein [Klebsiella pneumoniae subsp. pneumoniae]